MRAKRPSPLTACALGSCVFALAILTDLESCASAAETPGVTVLSDNGGATYFWDEGTEIQSELHLITSIPSTFTGTDVGVIIGADRFYSNGITGLNTMTTNIEAGHVWGGHETLTHVTSRTNAGTAPGAPFGTPAYDRHATWTGMMIGGRNGVAPLGPHEVGIAQDTDLRSGAIATSWSGTAYALSFSATVTTLDFPYSSAVSGFGTADVINSSWGSTGTGAGSPERQGTDIRATLIDGLANGNRFTTFVSSAGNSGSTIGTNSVGSPGAGYNGITVGALANDGANNYNAVASFSSRGPQDYGDPTNGLVAAGTAQRAAVDIVAPGSSLTSAGYGGQTGGNDASLAGSVNSPGNSLYSGGLNGTSFASPIVAGSVALMDSAAKANALPAEALDARVVKANLLNAARKIAGWNNGQIVHPNGNGGVSTSQALDFNSGAGALDLDRTYDQYLNGQTDIAGLIGGTTSEVIGWDYAEVPLLGSTDLTISTPLLGGSEFRATLAWFRERTYINSSTQTDVGFADLDLEIWDSTFTTLYSESVSEYTPVEHLAFTLPVTGLYGLRVNHSQDVFGNLATEQFGLAWWGVEGDLPDPPSSGIPEPSSTSCWLLLLGAGLYRRRKLCTTRG